MRGFRLSTKLYGAFTLSLGILALLGGFSIIQMNTMGNISRSIKEATIPRLVILDRIGAALNDFRRKELTHVILTDVEKKKVREKWMGESSAEFQSGIKEFQSFTANAKEKSLLNELAKHIETYLSINKKILVHSINHENETTEKMAFGESKQALDQAEKALKSLRDTSLHEAEQESSNAVNINSRSRNLTIILIVAGCILMAIASILLTRAISRPIHGIVSGLTEVAERK